MIIASFYHADTPAFLKELSQTPELQRLRGVGMNCGCEYTRFPRFRRLKGYSRYDHSLGTARIVWHFTGDPAQSAAALFHDIATPTFAHSVDFLRGDALRQEATEEGTERIIRSSPTIGEILHRYDIPTEAVVDYHRYPIADNDSPRLSADRLEYTLGNLENFRLRPPAFLRLSDTATAIEFGFDALRCSRIYVSDEDRYAMQMLSELLGRSLERGFLTEEDLMGTETALIEKLRKNPQSAAEWKAFRSLRQMITEEALAPPELRRVIRAKKRCIDPLVAGKGRLSTICSPFAQELQAFLEEDQGGWLCAK